MDLHEFDILVVEALCFIWPDMIFKNLPSLPKLWVDFYGESADTGFGPSEVRAPAVST